MSVGEHQSDESTDTTETLTNLKHWVVEDDVWGLHETNEHPIVASRYIGHREDVFEDVEYEVALVREFGTGYQFVAIETQHVLSLDGAVPCSLWTTSLDEALHEFEAYLHDHRAAPEK